MLPNMTTRFLKKSSGMTLLEVLVSMLLIGSALGMSLSMIQSSLQFERNALQRGIFIDAVDELVALIRSNELCASSYDFDGYTLDANNRPIPNFTDGNCTPDNFEGSINLIQKSHKRAQTDVQNWIADLMQHFPQGNNERRKTKVDYRKSRAVNLPVIEIKIDYLNIPETSGLAENPSLNDVSITLEQTILL